MDLLSLKRFNNQIIKRSRFSAGLLISLLFLFITDVIFFWFSSLPIQNNCDLIIKEGSSALIIYNQILEKKLIKRPLYFKFGLNWFSQSLHYGFYTLAKTDTPYSLIQQIKKGDSCLHEFRIIEGSNWKQLLETIKKNPYLKITLDQEQAQKDLMNNLSLSSLEGIFLADTYYFKSGTLDSYLLKKAALLQKEFLNKILNTKEREFSSYDYIILASILEKEGKTFEDFQLMSSVFHNRLKKNMRLQSDATVYYALNSLKKQPLNFEDLKIDHAFNTYKIKGLPPTPIAYPSKNAMIASVEPAVSNYYFFYTQPSGHLICSQHYKDHLDASTTP